ncbi:MAG: sodium ABC transporter [Candidatus Improbicoccus devescovinae]|nr:MAG: sodium ABC transporter [Candidatus Improbicoccus devescovinae]
MPQFYIIFAKELKSIVRDKKTFLISIFLPFMLVPTILFIINFSSKINQNKFLKNINLGISTKNNFFHDFCAAQSNINIVDCDKKDLKTGKISAYFTIDEALDEKIINNQPFKFEAEYDVSTLNSITIIPSIKYYESNFYEFCNNISDFMDENNKISYEKAKNFIQSYEISPNDLENSNQYDINNLYFSTLVPMMLVFYCCIGSSSHACDMTVGEKERGTLEPLLATGTNRSFLVLGKLLAASVTGVTSVVSTSVGLVMYKIISSGGLIEFSLKETIILIIMISFCSIFFASLNLIIGIFSKTYKEAQILIMPLSILCLLPVYFTYFLNLSNIPDYYFWIPVLNLICIIKELLVNIINIAHICFTILSFSICISIVYMLAIKMFNREKVIFRM